MKNLNERITMIAASLRTADALRHAIKDDSADLRREIDAAVKDKVAIAKSISILQIVAERIQKSIKSELQALVTLAFRSVFPARSYKFRIDFEKNRDKLVCRPVVEEAGWEYTDVENDVGGGLLHVASVALRAIMLVLRIARGENIRRFIWFDEPLTAVGIGDAPRRAANMLLNISRKLGIQVVITTHSEEFMEIGDRVWRFTHNGTHTESELVVDKWK